MGEKRGGGWDFFARCLFVLLHLCRVLLQGFPVWSVAVIGCVCVCVWSLCSLRLCCACAHTQQSFLPPVWTATDRKPELAEQMKGWPWLGFLASLRPMRREGWGELGGVCVCASGGNKKRFVPQSINVFENKRDSLLSTVEGFSFFWTGREGGGGCVCGGGGGTSGINRPVATLCGRRGGKEKKKAHFVLLACLLACLFVWCCMATR